MKHLASAQVKCTPAASSGSPQSLRAVQPIQSHRPLRSRMFEPHVNTLTALPQTSVDDHVLQNRVQTSCQCRLSAVILSCSACLELTLSVYKPHVRNFGIHDRYTKHVLQKPSAGELPSHFKLFSMSGDNICCIKILDAFMTDCTKHVLQKPSAGELATLLEPVWTQTIYVYEPRVKHLDAFMTDCTDMCCRSQVPASCRVISSYSARPELTSAVPKSLMHS